MPALDVSAADDAEFAAAWRSMEARGFQWSEGNIEKAHLGWLLARADVAAIAEENARMRRALERAGLRFDMLAPLVIAGNSKLAVTKWANEARAAALGEEKA